MNKIFSRGLNFHGQCGLGKEVKYSLEKFVQIPNLNYKIDSVYSNFGQNFALLEGMII